MYRYSRGADAYSIMQFGSNSTVNVRAAVAVRDLLLHGLGGLLVVYDARACRHPLHVSCAQSPWALKHTRTRGEKDSDISKA